MPKKTRRAWYGQLRWQAPQTVPPRQLKCGHCGTTNRSDIGYGTQDQSIGVWICPECTFPSFVAYDEHTPGHTLGRSVAHLPPLLDDLYEEARDCLSVSAYTATVLLCRKLLMNLAVSEGAAHNLTFQSYVAELVNRQLVPANAKVWVDSIRKKGNDATHEIPLCTQHDAEVVLEFAEMMLRLVYELPHKAI